MKTEEYLWIFASLVLVIIWIYLKDFIRTDGATDIYPPIIAFAGVWLIYKFIDNKIYKNIKGVFKSLIFHLHSCRALSWSVIPLQNTKMPTLWG
jgi:hypothetical protein